MGCDTVGRLAVGKEAVVALLDLEAVLLVQIAELAVVVLDLVAQRLVEVLVEVLLDMGSMACISLD